MVFLYSRLHRFIRNLVDLPYAVFLDQDCRSSEVLCPAGIVHGFQRIGQYRLAVRLGNDIHVGRRAADRGLKA